MDSGHDLAEPLILNDAQRPPPQEPPVDSAGDRDGYFVHTEEDPHEPTGEEQAGILSSLSYAWIGHMIRTAASGGLPRGIVLPLSAQDKTRRLAIQLYRSFATEREAATRWDDCIDDAHRVLRLKDDPASRGVLKWIGHAQQRSATELLAGIEWLVPPREYTRPSMKHVFTDGIVDGDRLFDAPSGRATLEAPDSLRFVCNMDDGRDRRPPRGPSLYRALFPLTRLVRLGLIPRFFYEVCYLAGPILLERFIDFISDKDAPWWEGAVVAALYFIAAFGQSTAFQKHFHMVMRSGLHLRNALMSAIFHKALTISGRAAAHPDLSTGRVVNMMSGDVERINELCGFILYLVSMPIQIVVALAMLYRLIGWIAFASVGLTLLMIPVQSFIVRLQYKTRTALSAATDRRVKAVNELFTAIRVVKFMGWEQRFVDTTTELREVELGFLRRIQYYRVATSLIMSMTPTIVMAGVFILLSVTGVKLTARVVFPTMALLNILRFPFMMLPYVVNMILTATVAVRRLERFLGADDATIAAQALGPNDSGSAVALEHADVAAFQADEVPARPKPPGLRERLFGRKKVAPAPEAEAEAEATPEESGAEAVDEGGKEAGSNTDGEKEKGQERGSKEDKDSEKAAADKAKKKEDAAGDKYYAVRTKTLLHDVSLRIPTGKLTVVLGPTGCGKTVLLESMLGDLLLQRGAVRSHSDVAYVPQQAWIMNATVGDNVLFFDDKDDARLARALRCCQLEPDIRLLDDGLDTEIGERGVNLSGGQRARVCLARAVYARKALYLLDDPLSAVDAHVGKRLVRDCILGELAGTTRVLVTHQTHVAPHADHIIALDQGRVAFAGDVAAFHQWQHEANLASPSTPGMAQFLSSCAHDEAHASDEGEPAKQADRADRGDDAEVEAGAEESKPEGQPEDGKKKGLMSEEERATGSVPMGTYTRYFRSCGGLVRMVLLLALFAFTECFNAGNSLWLSFWTERRFDDLTERDYLYIFIGIVVSSSFGAAVRSFVIYQTGRIGSRNLHRDMLSSVSVAPMAFFDTTPLGRVLNRFAKDIDTVDNDLPSNLSALLVLAFSIGSSTLIMVASQPFVIIAIVPVAAVYYRILLFYNSSNREVKRVDSINKSPVFALLSEALDGAKTIAAFRRAPAVLRAALSRIDAIFSTSYMQQVCNRWLGFRLDILGNVILTTLATAGVVTKIAGIQFNDVGLISLGMSLASSVTMMMNWLIRNSASVEAGMNSVERIVHYTSELDREDFAWYGDGRPNPLPLLPLPSYLPAAAAPPAPGTVGPAAVTELSLEFRGVSLRYRDDLPLVLHGLSFTVAPRQKVGLVGRTGSGKSTTLLALLRIVPLADGDVVIGGQPASRLALQHLRSLFAMIPQDPVLFTGSVRSNLDPFGEHSDPDVLRALGQVGMRERCEKDGGVECAVVEGGKNFSVGQRQLLCLARALLTKGTGFILMDEATANIDRETDRQIQRTIATAFADRTVITIAHRLNTVLSNDLIVVMDKGRAVEVGPPAELASNPDGVLRSMMAAGGKQQEQRLLDIAFGRHDDGAPAAPLLEAPPNAAPPPE